MCAIAYVVRRLPDDLTPFNPVNAWRPCRGFPAAFKHADVAVIASGRRRHRVDCAVRVAGRSRAWFDRFALLVRPAHPPEYCPRDGPVHASGQCADREFGVFALGGGGAPDRKKLGLEIYAPP